MFAKKIIRKRLVVVVFLLSAIWVSMAGCRTVRHVAKQPDTVLQLLPGDNNPRNSEGDFIALKDGRILFVYSRYLGDSGSDHAPAFLAGRYSSDGGNTWTTEDQVVVQQEGQMNVMSVSLLRLQNGQIALFYLVKNSMTDCKPMVRFSSDEGKTWSEAIPCIQDKEGYFVLNNARVIQLSSGRLILAVALHQVPGGKWNQAGRLYAYYSDDNGKTWTSGAEVANPNNLVTQEPGLVELKDGRIMMFIRASGGVQQLSYSSDKGQTWSAIIPSNIQSPLAPATIVRIPKTGDLLLVWNNIAGREERLEDRTPLTVGISKDEGKTWIHVKNIESDPEGWYCYTAVHFVDNDVLLGYFVDMKATYVRKIGLPWFYLDGQER